MRKTYTLRNEKVCQTANELLDILLCAFFTSILSSKFYLGSSHFIYVFIGGFDSSFLPMNYFVKTSNNFN